MSMMKDFVARGIFYSNIGICDYPTWSRLLCYDFGPEINRFVKDIRKWSIAFDVQFTEGRNPKINCWEFMGCGLHVSSSSTDSQYPVCPAYTEKRFNGVHGGKNAGRVCWLVSNTMCNSSIQGACEQKYPTCMTCDFYRYVMDEEETAFICSHDAKNAASITS